VAWQDIPWDGRVCHNPGQNAACLILKNVRQNKDETRESRPEVAGQTWTSLAEADLPPCVNERAGFMAPFELVHDTRHPYAETSPIHGHFLPTPLRHPPHSAACIPFLWMLREEAEKKVESLQLGYQAGLEDEVNKRMGFGEVWVQHRDNQLALLDTFLSAIVPDQSLCFFYAKRTPLADDPRRTIVAVGRVRHVGEPLEYKYSKQGLHRAMIWDRMVQHSIRSQGGEGFVPITRSSHVRSKIRPQIRADI
jgi:hypothetical protein